MKAVKVDSTGKGKTKKEIIVSEVIEASNFFSKLSGLIFRRKLKDSQGFLIRKCNSVHTIGMMYRIDVVFLDKKNRVSAIYCNLKPFRVTPFVKDAFSVLEAQAGVIGKTSLKVTDLVFFETL